MTYIYITEPSSCKEAAEEQVWWDAMTEQSDVWETVPKPWNQLLILSMQLLMKSSFETKEVSLEDFWDVEEEIWFCGKRFPPKLPL